jgi:hypothetical protein
MRNPLTARWLLLACAGVAALLATTLPAGEQHRAHAAGRGVRRAGQQLPPHLVIQSRRDSQPLSDRVRSCQQLPRLSENRHQRLGSRARAGGARGPAAV